MYVVRVSIYLQNQDIRKGLKVPSLIDRLKQHRQDLKFRMERVVETRISEKALNYIF